MPINKERAEALIAHLRAHDGPKLNMWGFYEERHGHLANEGRSIQRRLVSDNWCGTHACIAGHAVIVAIKAGDITPVKSFDYESVATEWLGLPWDEIDGLFYDWNDPHSVEEAVNKLRALIEAA